MIGGLGLRFGLGFGVRVSNGPWNTLRIKCAVSDMVAIGPHNM